MSFHKTPKYQIPELIQALKDHGLEWNTPSQLSDAFRLGWFAVNEKKKDLHPLATEIERTRISFEFSRNPPYGDCLRVLKSTEIELNTLKEKLADLKIVL